jgi:hypothetical protein
MSKYETAIDASGPGSNIFAILGKAIAFMRTLKVSQSEIADITSRVAASKSYKEACDVIREWFPIEGL